MSFFESLKRLFGGTGQDGRSGDLDAYQDGASSAGSQGDTAVAMISCDEASARLFEYLDGELEGVSEEEVRGHLEICEACYPRVQFEKHFLEALRRSQNGGQASASLKERVLLAIEEEPGRD